MRKVISDGVGADVHRRRDGRYSLSPQQTIDDVTLALGQLVERRHMGCIDLERLGVPPAASVELGCEAQQMAFEGRDPLGVGSWRELGSGFGEHERHGGALVFRQREEQTTSLSPSSSRMAEAYPHEGAFRGFGGLSDRTH